MTDKESLSWEDMEDGKEYEVTVRGRAIHFQFGPKQAVSLYSFLDGHLDRILIGWRELVDDEVTLKIAPVGKDPVPLTKEEKIASRKRWDARYDEQHGN